MRTVCWIRVVVRVRVEVRVFSVPSTADATTFHCPLQVTNCMHPSVVVPQLADCFYTQNRNLVPLRKSLPQAKGFTVIVDVGDSA